METLELLKEELMPSHVAIIMDGNGRWATKRGLARSLGHREGMKRVVEVVETSVKLGIKSLTLFAFSTENWKRPKDEVDNLMKLLVVFVNNELKRLSKNNVRLKILGDIEKLPSISRMAVEKALKKTEENTGLILNIALNYGGQTEIVRAAKKLARDAMAGEVDLDSLDEESFKDYLYTRGQDLPDLLIRPSGELRISNFLLYQIAYTEFYFADILWPDFNEEEYYKAILDYQKRDRRYGGL